MNYVILDFETRSHCDLKKCGALVYSEDPTTEVVCIGYSINGEPAKVWYPPYSLGEFRSAVEHGFLVVAHNVSFEKAIWRNVLKWSEPPGGWFDTMASCAYRSLPLDLEKAAEVLDLPHQKQKISMSFAKPKKDGSWDESYLDKVYDYCRQDVDTEVALFKKLGLLPPEEMETWRLDQEINERGMAVDRRYISDCKEIVRQASKPLLREFAELTKGFSYVNDKDKLKEYPNGLTPTQATVLPYWFRTQGLNIPNMKAETIDEILGKETLSDEEVFEAHIGDDREGEGAPKDGGAGESQDIGVDAGAVVSVPARKALEIRRVLGSSSVKKLDRIPNCIADDGRAHNLVQYHGASTGRWTGRLFQVQNFPRGTVGHDVDNLVEAIGSRDHEQVAALYGEPVAAVSSGLRHALVAEKGKRLLVGDFSTIEIRVNLAFAGQWDKVELLRKGGDPYLDMASQIYQNPEMVTLPKAEAKEKYPKERQDGKNSVLGLGFQMGAKKFRNRYAPDRPVEFAERVVDTFRQSWAPRIRGLWYALDEAAEETVRTGKAHEAKGVAMFRMEDGFLTMEIPSGRKLWYWNPRIENVPCPWDKEKTKPTVLFDTKKLGKWMTVSGFGGLWDNNLVQGLARDLLVHAMKNCQQEGLPVVLTAHDEIVCETDKNWDTPEAMEEIMCEVPEWAKRIGVPMAAECWTGERYRK